MFSQDDLLEFSSDNKLYALSSRIIFTYSCCTGSDCLSDLPAVSKELSPSLIRLSNCIKKNTDESESK